MKILIIGEAFYPEDFIINDLAQQWVKDGYQIEVLTRTPSYPYGQPYKGYKNKLYQQTLFSTLKIHRFPIIKGYHHSVFLKVLNYLAFVFFGSIVALFIGKRFDKIFVYHTGPLTLALPALLIKKLYRKKMIIWTQDIWPDSVYAYGFKKNLLLAFLLKSIVKSVYNNCEYIFISCEGFAQRLGQFIHHQKIIYAPNWPLIDASSNEAIQNDIGKINFTFTGNIGKVQNLENVINGFSKISRINLNIFLNIVGDGSNLENLKKIVSDQKIENVIFWGRKPLNEIPEIMSDSDVLLLSLIDAPIFELTIPSKFQTYLTANKPIFGIIKGNVKKLIEDNNIGHTANPSDIESIIKGFEKFISMSDVNRKQMAINSKILLATEFDRNTIIERITKIVFE